MSKKKVDFGPDMNAKVLKNQAQNVAQIGHVILE